MSTEIPQEIAHYKIIDKLGKGGMATVYLANDPRFDRQVAIKVLPREFLHEAKFISRFDQEAKAIAKLEHPSIVPVYDYGNHEGQPFLVMRYMPGGSLKDQLDKGALAPQEILQIIQRLAGALTEAHGQGIIHRDLKPGNILFDKDNRAYLSDFGIAKIKEATINLTGDSIIGTPAYMSPEQVHGDRKLDGRSDIYALGIILYEMLTGEKPYKAETPAKMLMKHVLEPAPRILDSRADLPAGIDSVTMRALAKDPEERFQSPHEMATALSESLRGRAAPPAKRDPIKTPKVEEKDGTIPMMEAEMPAPAGARSPRPSQPKKKRSNVILWLIGIPLVVALLAGTSYLTFSILDTFLGDSYNAPAVVESQPDENDEEGPITVPHDDEEENPTETPEPEPTLTPTIAVGELVVSINDEVWENTIDRANVYRLHPITEVSLSRYDLQVDVVFNDDISEFHGLLFNQQERDDQLFYSFRISPVGTYSFDIWDNGDHDSLVGPLSSELITRGEGAVNTLRVVVDDGEFTLYINGEMVTTLTHHEYGEGFAGLITCTCSGSENTSVSFLNFSLSRLP